MNGIRHLDMDDLILLGNLLHGDTLAASARKLGVTQPAITQRIRKIEGVFGDNLLVKSGRSLKLTNKGRAVCIKASEAMKLMMNAVEEAQTPIADPIMPMNLMSGDML
jgi:predicted transcriptional regulator